MIRKRFLSFFLFWFYNDYGDSMNDFGKGMLKGLAFVIIVGAIIYFVSYRNWLNQDFGDLVVEYKEDEDVIKPTKEDVDYKDIYDKVNFKMLEENFGSEFYDMYYMNIPFSDEYYLYVAIINIIHKELLTECNYYREISSVEVEWKVKEIFGDVEFKKISFETKDKHLSINYNEGMDIFIVRTNSCSGYDYANGGIYTTALDYKTEGDYLYIYEKAMYLNYTYDNFNNLLFNYHEGIHSTDRIIANDIDKVDLAKIPTYKLLFKKTNDSYAFVGVQK